MDFEKDILNCIKVLSSGGLILYPTDTVWGIGCDATDSDAVDRVMRLKKRPGDKSLIILVADEKDVIKHVASPDFLIFDYLEKINRPTTVIYENGLGFADNVLAADGSVAIRICNEMFCKHLLKRYRKPIVSTSANISGSPAPQSFRDIGETIRNGVDYIVEYRQQEETSAKPSSIIRWRNGRPEFVR